MNTPITKKVQDAMGAKARAIAKQTSESGGVMGKLREIDANVNANIAKAGTKPAVKEGSMQEFVEYGPGPAIRRGIEAATPYYNAAKNQAKKEWNQTKKVVSKVFK